MSENTDPTAASGTTAAQKEAEPEAPRGGRGGRHQPGQKAKAFLPTMKRLAASLAPDWLRLVIVLVTGVLGVLFAVISPKLLGNATTLIFAGFISKSLPAGLSREQVLSELKASGHADVAKMLQNMPLTPGHGIDFTALQSLLLLIAGLYLISSLFQWAQSYVLNDVVVGATYKMRSEIEDKIHRLPLSYFDTMKRGELLSRVTNDIDNVQQTLQQTLGQLISSVLTVIGVVIMMFLVSPLLALIALIAIPLTGVIAWLIARQSQKLFKTQWKQTGVLNATVEETYTGHALVKLYGQQERIQDSFSKTNQALYTSSFGAQFVSGIIMPAMMFVGNLVYALVAVIGGLQVASGRMLIGDVQAFIQYSRQFTQPLSQIGSMANMLQSGAASAERIFELLDADEQAEDGAPAELPERRTGELSFEHIRFSYSPDEPLIHDLSLEVSPGQTVAIVGPTGAGKTTLVNLILRFYELDGGRITLDGVDIARMTRDQLRSQIGMVLQDTWLFTGTIRDNIAYGRPDATDDEITQAARATGVDHFTRTLPNGYDTMLDDGGANLSTGERQLLTIARAFLAQPNVLILDEATSSVDTRTELLVQQAMSALRQDRTSFVIAHRLSTIRDADTILVMEHGDIVEQGNHADLLAQNGAYAALYKAQFTSSGETDQS